MNADLLSNLERLAKLKENGSLTEAEYEEQKQILLKSSTPAPKVDTPPMTNSRATSRVVGIILIVGICLFTVFMGHGAFDTPVPEEEKAHYTERFFSPYDGSNRELEQKIKETMNDPDSYEHVSTTYKDQGETLLVKTQFRGKNAFGGVITNSATATIDKTDGHVIDWAMIK